MQDELNAKAILSGPIDRADRVPTDASEFYRILVSRNHHFVSPRAQDRIRELKVLVAGCGSGGGAVIEPLARLGVMHFKLADNGAYELANYNRQRAYLDELGVNKAEVQLKNLRKLNPFVEAEAFPEGLAETNIVSLVDWADLIFDCVDVTTPDGIRIKLRLHELAHAKRKPTLFALDLGYCQTGHGFDYRDPAVRPLWGRLEAARRASHPVKALLTFYPVSKIPAHTLQLAEDALLERKVPISQMECASDLLSSVASAALIRFAETGTLVRSWRIDLGTAALSPARRLSLSLSAPWKRLKLRRLLRRLP